MFKWRLDTARMAMTNHQDLERTEESVKKGNSDF